MNHSKTLMAIVMIAFGPVAWSQSPLRVRVLTYNIHHGQGVDGKLDLARIASVINEVNPDVVALQEVDSIVARSDRVDQPAELARLTKMNVVYGDNIKLGDGKYGNALLSRFPILESKNHRLPNHERGEQRGFLKATLKLPNGEPLVFVATHFDHRRNDAERLMSAKKINEFAVNGQWSSAMLAGDLNDTADSRALGVLKERWQSVNDKPAATYPAEQPTRQIDFILFRPSGWKVIESRVLPESIASDHRALFAVLERGPDGERPSDSDSKSADKKPANTKSGRQAD